MEGRLDVHMDIRTPVCIDMCADMKINSSETCDQECAVVEYVRRHIDKYVLQTYE